MKAPADERTDVARAYDLAELVAGEFEGNVVCGPSSAIVGHTYVNLMPSGEVGLNGDGLRPCFRGSDEHVARSLGGFVGRNFPAVASDAGCEMFLFDDC